MPSFKGLLSFVKERYIDRESPQPPKTRRKRAASLPDIEGGLPSWHTERKSKRRCRIDDEFPCFHGPSTPTQQASERATFEPIFPSSLSHPRNYLGVQWKPLVAGDVSPTSPSRTRSSIRQPTASREAYLPEPLESTDPAISIAKFSTTVRDFAIRDHPNIPEKKVAKPTSKTVRFSLPISVHLGVEQLSPNPPNKNQAVENQVKDPTLATAVGGSTGESITSALPKLARLNAPRKRQNTVTTDQSGENITVSDLKKYNAITKDVFERTSLSRHHLPLSSNKKASDGKGVKMRKPKGKMDGRYVEQILMNNVILATNARLKRRRYREQEKQARMERRMRRQSPRIASLQGRDVEMEGCEVNDEDPRRHGPGRLGDDGVEAAKANCSNTDHVFGVSGKHINHNVSRKHQTTSLGSDTLHDLPPDRDNAPNRSDAEILNYNESSSKDTVRPYSRKLDQNPLPPISEPNFEANLIEHMRTKELSEYERNLPPNGDRREHALRIKFLEEALNSLSYRQQLEYAIQLQQSPLPLYDLSASEQKAVFTSGVRKAEEVAEYEPPTCEDEQAAELSQMGLKVGDVALTRGYLYWAGEDDAPEYMDKLDQLERDWQFRRY